MKRGLSNTRGFSLIELMIVVSIIAVMSAIAVPNFSNWAPKFRLRSTSDNLTKHLMLARTTAIAQNHDVVVTFYKDQGKYRITHKAGEENYSLPQGIVFEGIYSSTISGEIEALAPITSITFSPFGNTDIRLVIKYYADSNKLADNKRMITVNKYTGLTMVSEVW
jgi:prepilin-type N-terminal cleavage/methylation domain-containing protein